MNVMDEPARSRVTIGNATYLATFELGEDGFWAAQVVEVPEAISQGRSLDEARRNVEEALAAALELRTEEGKEIPPGGRVAVAPVSTRR